MRGGEGDVCFFRRGGVCWSRGALCECAARERRGRQLKPLFADLAGKTAGNVLNMEHTLLLWRCAPGLGARVEFARRMNDAGGG